MPALDNLEQLNRIKTMILSNLLKIGPRPTDPVRLLQKHRGEKALKNVGARIKALESNNDNQKPSDNRSV